MALAFEIEGKKYRVKGPGEVTLADWKDLTRVPLDGKSKLDDDIELVKRHTGIPKGLLRKLKIGESEKIFTAIGSILAEAQLYKSREYVHEPTYELDGVTYTVPNNLEAECVSGQWWDLDGANQCEHEADAMVACLMAMLVPVGQQYDGNAGRRPSFMGMKVADAFGMSAFFFDNSERFRASTRRLLTHLVSSVMLRNKEALKSSTNATASGSRSSGPQKRSPSSKRSPAAQKRKTARKSP